MKDHQQFYVNIIRAEYRAMGRVQRWLLQRIAPFMAISVRHLAGNCEHYQADGGTQ